MNMDQSKTVRDWVREIPVAASVFEEMGIEYCCDGGQTLERACAKAHKTVSQVEKRIVEKINSASRSGGGRDWANATLSDLMVHIVEAHHSPTRRELERLAPLARTVARVHGKFHPELLRIQSVFDGMSEELTMHMNKEEQSLFPYIAEVEEAVLERRHIRSTMRDSSLPPVTEMIAEHESAAEHLHEIREASHNFEVPAGGCLSYRSFYEGLKALEKDLHQHVSLENNILFPRALEMKSSSRN